MKKQKNKQGKQAAVQIFKNVKKVTFFNIIFVMLGLARVLKEAVLSSNP